LCILSCGASCKQALQGSRFSEVVYTAVTIFITCWDWYNCWNSVQQWAYLFIACWDWYNC